VDRTAEELLARAKRFAHRVTYDELVAQGMAALEEAGFDGDQIEIVAGMVGSTADELAHSMATATPGSCLYAHEGVKVEGFGEDDRRLLSEIRELIESPVVERTRRCLTRQEAELCLGVELTQLDYLVRARKVRFVKLGEQRGRVFRTEDLDDFLKSNLQLTAEEVLRRKPRGR